MHATSARQNFDEILKTPEEIEEYSRSVKAENIYNIAANRLHYYLQAERLGSKGAITGALDYLETILAQEAPFDFKTPYNKGLARARSFPRAMHYHTYAVTKEEDNTSLVSARPTFRGIDRSPPVTVRSIEKSPDEKASILSATLSANFIAFAAEQAERDRQPIPVIGVNRFTVLIQRALRLMAENNKAEGGRLKYHMEDHPAEMIMDVMRKAILKSKALRGFTPKQIAAFIKLDMLISGIHDAYYKGMRGIDEMTCADILVRELVLEVTIEDSAQDVHRKKLIDLIGFLTIGGTLPEISDTDTKTSTMLHLLATNRIEKPTETNLELEAAFQAADIIGECDVHRTQTPWLRSSVRIERFNRTTRSMLSPVLKTLLTRLLNNALLASDFELNESNRQAILDMLGQNLRTIFESNAPLGSEAKESDLELCNAYIEIGKKIAKGQAIVCPSEAPSIKIIEKFISGPYSESAFAIRFANTYLMKNPDQPKALWTAHAIFLKSLAELKGTSNESFLSEILRYSLIRAGCLDGPYFKSFILSPRFDAVRMLNAVLQNPKLATDRILQASLIPTPTCWNALYNRAATFGDRLFGQITGARRNPARVMPDMSSIGSGVTSTTLPTLTLRRTQTNNRLVSSGKTSDSKP